MLAGSLARAVANLLALSRHVVIALAGSRQVFKPEKVASLSQTPANLSETCPLARASGPSRIIDFGLYRQDAAKRQTKFTHKPKMRFFAPQGRLVAPIHVKPKMFSVFYTTNYPTLAFQISCDSLHRLRSYC